MEIIGQILGFLFAYYLLRLAYKLYGKNRISAAVLIVWASVFIMLCSSQWFQVWVKSFIASNITVKLAAFNQQVGAIQKTTKDMHDQLVGIQTQIEAYQQKLDQVQTQIENAQTNVNAIQETAMAMNTQITSQQAKIDQHQNELDDVQDKIRNAETSNLNQQSVNTNQFQQIQIIQSQLAGAVTNFAAQEKKLAEVEQWVKKLFGRTASDTSPIQYTNNLVQ